MSDVHTTTAIDRETIELLPSRIKTDSRYNVRPFSSNSTDTEEKLILELAASIEGVGQLDALLVDPNNTLIAGHRRRKAVIIVNERRTARGQSLLKLRCSVDRSGGDLRRKSIISNLHRKDQSPMDLAYLIFYIREENGWKGWQGTKKVAEYLGVNEATVTQHERFLSADKDLQNKIHSGVISAQSGLDLLKGLGTAKERTQALHRANEIQQEERLDKTFQKLESGKKSLEETAQALIEPPKPRIEHPAIVKAIRERAHLNPRRRLCLSRSELVSSLAQFDSPEYSPPVREFIRYFTKTYALGQGSQEELRARFLQAIPDVGVVRRQPMRQAMTS